MSSNSVNNWDDSTNRFSVECSHSNGLIHYVVVEITITRTNM